MGTKSNQGEFTKTQSRKTCFLNYFSLYFCSDVTFGGETNTVYQRF